MLSALPVRRAVWLLTLGVGAAGMTVASDGAAKPSATASRACAYQNTSVRRASAPQLRAAVVCLIDGARRRWHLPPLRQSGRLDFAAQYHVLQMVSAADFSHDTGRGRGSTPALRLDEAGFDWSALGEAISTGYPTPRAAVNAWLASTEHCRILLSPLFDDVGIGVSRRHVRGYTSRPGTWTADLALGAWAHAPSGNWAPAGGCPY